MEPSTSSNKPNKMAKVMMPPKDSGLSLPTTGRWMWKDETNTLEFISNNPASNKDDKRRKNKVHDASKSRQMLVENRVASCNTRNVGRGRAMARGKSPRQRKDENAVVTIEDIKGVAVDMMSEVIPMAPAFDTLYRTEQFNDFLLHLLSYFNCFFEKMEQENKKNPMYIEPSLAEKQAYANVLARLEIAQKLLGQSYCTLVLGLGLEDQHHMMCGHARVSNTLKDRNIFETFYGFCNFVVWIAFRRKEFEYIKKEIGRMMRSDTFNPAIRIKYATEEMPRPPRKENGRYVDRMDKVSPAQYRRLHPKRPAIKSMITQRSPAIVSILPLPKEEAQRLFKHTRSATPDGIAPGPSDEEKDDEKVLQMVEELTIDPRKFKVGILGEPLNMFSPTLTPLGAETEDGENEGEEGEKADEESAEKTSGSERASRLQTAVSHVTTEVYSDEENE